MDCCVGHPMNLNVHIPHLITDKGSPHSGGVSLELRKFEDRFFQIRNTHWKSALTPQGSGSRIFQSLNAEGQAFQDCLIDWSVLKKSQIISNQEPCGRSRGKFYFFMGKVICQVTVPSRPQVSRAVRASTRKNLALQPAGLPPSTRWSHTKLLCDRDGLVGDYKPGSCPSKPSQAAQEVICARSRDATLLLSSADRASKAEISFCAEQEGTELR